MSDRIKVEFEMLDPNHTNEEVIRWITKILNRIGIEHPKVWIWIPEEKPRRTTKSAGRRRQRSR